MRRWKFFVVGAILSIFPINVVHAQEGEKDEKDVTLETIVVTGTRVEEKIEKIPANITVISEDQMKNTNAKNLTDLLRSEEGIVVRDPLGNGKTSQVDLRGYGETAAYNTAVLVDGRRVNEIDLSGIDWTQIPLEQIERIEVLRGTGTVLYGDNAVGGVINIITKRPPEKLTLRAAGSLGSYDSNREEAYIGGGYKNFAGSLSASHQSTDGYRDNNDFSAKNVGGKVVFDPTDFLSFNLAGSYHTDDYGLPGPLTEEQVKEDRKDSTRPFDEAETKDGFLKLLVDLDLGKYGGIVTDFSYRSRKTEEKFVSSTFEGKRDVDTWAITPRYVWDGNLFGHENRLIAGIDFYSAKQDVDSFFGTPLEPSARGKVKRDTIGFYFNDEFSVLENLVLTLGARREKAEYDLKQEDLTGFLAPLDETVSDWETAYTAGVSYLYSGRSYAFARVNRSFRFPLSEELLVYDFLNGQILANPDIKPQTGMHYEVGVRHYFTPQIQTNLTLFWVKTDDEIFFNLTTFTNENYPETLRRGVEIGFKADPFKTLTVFGNYTYEKATLEKGPFENNDVPFVPRHKGNLGFRLHDLVPGFVLAADYNYVGSSYAISDQANQFGKQENYYAINARLSYEWRWLRAFVGVNNITDQDYSEYFVVGGFPQQLNFFPSPERNWVGGVEINF